MDSKATLGLPRSSSTMESIFSRFVICDDDDEAGGSSFLFSQLTRSLRAPPSIQNIHEENTQLIEFELITRFD